MGVYGIHQYRHTLRRGELADTVPQVENVGWPLAWSHVRLTKTVQHGLGLLGHLLGRSEKHIGVEIALNGMGRAELCTRFSGFAASLILLCASVLGAIVAADFYYNERARRNFKEAMIKELTFPKLIRVGTSVFTSAFQLRPDINQQVQPPFT